MSCGIGLGIATPESADSVEASAKVQEVDDVKTFSLDRRNNVCGQGRLISFTSRFSNAAKPVRSLLAC